jgi:hypothetical protein
MILFFKHEFFIDHHLQKTPDLFLRQSGKPVYNAFDGTMFSAKHINQPGRPHKPVGKGFPADSPLPYDQKIPSVPKTQNGIPSRRFMKRGIHPLPVPNFLFDRLPELSLATEAPSV